MTRRNAHLLAILLLLGVVGCSLLIDPRDAQPRCERVNDSEVCPMGLRCIEGRCAPSCEALEVCGDNVDNDCDGKTDEVTEADTCGDGLDNDCDGVTDEGSDPDDDGYTWCGNTLSKAGGAVDCDPYNSAIHPGAEEVCDGRDNDCDLMIDEAPPTKSLCGPGEECSGSCLAAASCTPLRGGCGEGERCDPELRRCVRSGQCGDRICAREERCDSLTNSCTSGPLENGAACSAHEDCRSQSCIRAAALRLADTPGAGVCGEACCSDDQCPEGQRCFASGSGARSCLPASMIPSGAPRQCTADAACQGGEVCALNRQQSLAAPYFVPHPELITSTCRAPQASAAKLGERCAYYGSCASRICVARAGGSGQLCSTPCGSSADCRAFQAAARRAGVSERVYCRYVTVNLDSALRTPDYAPICVIDRGGETGRGGTNEPCSSGRDCIEGGCVGATATRTGRCAPTCCNDDHCGRGEDGQPIHCRPFAFGNTYEMRCDLGSDP